jgi:hypothetical protein
MHAHGVIVNDVPTQFDATSKHSITTTDLTIPLDLLGVVSFFYTSFPQPGDFDTLPWVTLTAPANWVDYASTLSINERRVPDRISLLSSQITYQPAQLEPLHIDHSICHLMEDDTYYNATIASINIESTYTIANALPTIDETEDFISADANFLIGALQPQNSRSALDHVALAKRWGITLEQAKATLNSSTQTAVRNILTPSERKVRLKAPRLNFPLVKGVFYVDSLFYKIPSVNGFKGGSLFTNGLGYDRFYPFIHNVGVPQTLISDNAKEEILGRAWDTCTKYRIIVKTTVPHSPWQNLAKASIRELKKTVRRTIRQTNAPPKLWAACTSWTAGVQRLTASSIPQLKGQTPAEFVEGSTPDISAYALFVWYQPLYFWSPTIEFPNERKIIGRWIGVAEQCTDQLAYLVITNKSQILVRKSVWAIPNAEMKQAYVKSKLEKLDTSITNKNITKPAGHLNQQ